MFLSSHWNLVKSWLHTIRKSCMYIQCIRQMLLYSIYVFTSNIWLLFNVCYGLYFLGPQQTLPPKQKRLSNLKIFAKHTKSLFEVEKWPLTIMFCKYLKLEMETCKNFPTLNSRVGLPPAPQELLAELFGSIDAAQVWQNAQTKTLAFALGENDENGLFCLTEKGL